MSAGHRHHQEHTDALKKETKHLLEDANIKQYMAKPYVTDFSKKIPLTGGSNVAGDKYFVDADVPSRLRKYIMVHERVEKALRDVRKMRYDNAHKYATCAERMAVEKDGLNWESYKKEAAAIVRGNEKRGPERVPGLDPGPYEGAERRLLKR